MKRIITVILFTSIIAFSSLEAVKADFEVWSVREGVFVVGKPSPFLVYVENTDLIETINYTITYDVDYDYPLPGNDLSHLIQVHLVSDKIENLGPGQVRETQGAITLLGEIFEPGGDVTFTVQPDDGGLSQDTKITVTGSLSIALPEFTLIGLLQLFLLAGLVIFYSFHIR